VDVALKREKREPPPGGNCDISKTNTSYGAFDEGSCVLECKDKYLYEQCQCVNVRPPLKHPDVQNYRSCTLKEWADCGLKAYTDWTSRYMDPNFTEDNCYCPSACKETRYEAQLSSSSISPAYASKLLQAKPVQGYLKFVASNPAMNISYSTAEDILDNMMVVELLFTSMSVSEIRQVVTYTFYNMLGDIGGVLGLFLGASLFTILEFFQFLLFAVGKHCLGWKTGDDHEKLQDQEMPAMKEDQNRVQVIMSDSCHDDAVVVTMVVMDTQLSWLRSRTFDSGTVTNVHSVSINISCSQCYQSEVKRIIQ